MKNKILSLFLTVVMLFSVLSVGATAESLTDVPEGYTAIYTVEEFDNIRNDTTENYILMTDLDFSVMSDDYKWKRISGFKGIFNGNGHIIKGLNDGLFDSVSSATISDVKLVDISSDGPALAKSINNTIVNNIVVADFVMTNEKGGNLSSFINSATNSRIENCSVSATVKITSGQTVFGGILSEKNGTSITNCYTDGTADIKATTGNSIIAGIVPTNENSEILYCYNNMDLNLRSIYNYNLRAGGICYRSAANIQCCVNTGDIYVSAGNSSAGSTAYGITYGNGDVINCLNTGSVRALKPTNSGVGDGGTANALGSDIECSVDLLGKNEYTTESVYFFNDGTSNRVNALTAEEMKYEENFPELDFENIWYIDLESGVEHPQLKECPLKKTNTLVIDIPEEIKTIDVDETFALNATIYPKTAEDKLIYTSSDETVATVSSEGVVTAINPGFAVITITSENGTTTQCRLTVNAHIFGEITIITDATCTTEGSAIHICDTCGKTETVIIEKNPDSHKAESFYTVDIKADCENDGVKSHHCEYCNAPLDNVLIEKRGHDYSCTITKEPDCTEKGINTFVCRNAESTEYKACNSVYTEEIPSHGHSHTAVVTAPTCTENGYTTYTCECGDSYVADYVDANGHDYASAVTTPATHFKEGVMTYTCHCGDSYTESIAKIEKHEHTAVVTAPTCTEQGYTTYTCECGDSYVADYVDATGHSHTSEITTPATHISEGVMTFTCECGDTYTEVIEKTAEHSYKAVVTAPTCTEDGYTNYTCECGDSYVADYIKASHKDADKDYVCDICNKLINAKEVKDEQTDVSIVYSDGTFNDEINIEVTPVAEGDAFKLISHKEGNYKVTMFDINVTVNGENVQPNGTVLVKIPLPRGYNQNKCVVYYVADDGTLEELKTYHFKDGYVYFETDHFSYYAIIEEEYIDPNWQEESLSFIDKLTKFFNMIMKFFKKIFGII